MIGFCTISVIVKTFLRLAVSVLSIVGYMRKVACGNMKNKGFTLIELLVVISIIALLLSIIVPALSLAKERSRNVVCQSSLKQFSLANALYANANRDRVPFPTYYMHTQESYSKSPFHFNCRWHDDKIPADGPIWPYLDAKNITRCPTFAKVSKSEGSRHFDHDPAFSINPQFGYVMNAYLTLPEMLQSGVDNSDPKNWKTWKLSNIPNPYKVTIFCEENPFPVPGLSQFSLCTTYFMPAPPASSDRWASIATFHGKRDIEKGTSNISFADGHVSAADGTEPGTSYDLTGKSIDKISHLWGFPKP